MQKELLNKKEQELKDLGNSQPVDTVKSEKACFEKNIKGVARLSVNKEFMVLYEQKHCLFKLKEIETEQN